MKRYRTSNSPKQPETQCLPVFLLYMPNEERNFSSVQFLVSRCRNMIANVFYMNNKSRENTCRCSSSTSKRGPIALLFNIDIRKDYSILSKNLEYQSEDL